MEPEEFGPLVIEGPNLCRRFVLRDTEHSGHCRDALRQRGNQVNPQGGCGGQNVRSAPPHNHALAVSPQRENGLDQVMGKAALVHE